MRPIRETAAAWERIVRREPTLPNADVARRLGMSQDALERALSRARAAGYTSLRRRSTGRGVELEPVRRRT